MGKNKTRFVCQKCGAFYAKWSGRCENCGEWNTLLEEVVETEPKTTLKKAEQSGKTLCTLALNDIVVKKKGERLATGFSDFDTVLGGGILSGSVALLSGQPGIGKSTLLLQIAAKIAKRSPVLYVSGEESAEQVKLRAERLFGKSAGELHFASSTSANDIAQTVGSAKYAFIIVDSIQTLSLDEISSAPGTVSQVANSGNVLIRVAKKTGAAIMIVGHVTKDGTLAGPKTLEHMVDVVLHFEGDRYGGFKTIRAAKNRFGGTNEVAIFEMAETGLVEVENPSEALLAERQNTDGSIIFCHLDGTRPILVEIQALVNATSFGYPKRTSSGFDLNRLNLLIAVLEKRTKLKLGDKDIFINVVGGLRLSDSAADLAVCMAMASAAAGRKLDEKIVVFGEIGLGGEIRSVTGAEKRIAEAKKMGFTCAIAPKNLKDPFVVKTANLRDALIKYMR
ncbi:MAG: DNA repair protein RadA [Candidatus Nomurabacteria bacterium]|jgi:DNA repair protein RadA/Sms|nr:DNA repair protein RadA [Candidatus Nomurabacteria bacterium]